MYCLVNSKYITITLDHTIFKLGHADHAWDIVFQYFLNYIRIL